MVTVAITEQHYYAKDLKELFFFSVFSWKSRKWLWKESTLADLLRRIASGTL